MKYFIYLVVIFNFCFAQTYQTGTITITFNDPVRTGGFGSGAGPGRQIQTEVYYPAAIAGSNVAVASGSFPVVVIGHGFVMDWQSYDNVYSALSKRGYIVALPRTEGGFSPSHNDFGLDIALVGNKMLQLNSTNTLAPIFVSKVEQKLALAGHSMGGGSSFLAAKNNSSITCLFNFAAAQTNPASSLAAKLVTVPTLIIGGQADCVAPAATNQDKMWDSTAAAKKYEIIIKNLTHCDFGNGSNFNCTFGQNTSSCPNTVINATALKLYMNFVDPFLDFHLKGICSEGTRFMDSLNLSQVIFAKKQMGIIGCFPGRLTEESSIGRIYVYPNPATTNIHIINEGNKYIDQVLITDINGQLVKSFSSHMNLDISDLKSGLYFVRVRSHDTYMNFKFMKNE